MGLTRTQSEQDIAFIAVNDTPSRTADGREAHERSCPHITEHSKRAYQDRMRSYAISYKIHHPKIGQIAESVWPLPTFLPVLAVLPG